MPSYGSTWPSVSGPSFSASVALVTVPDYGSLLVRPTPESPSGSVTAVCAAPSPAWARRGRPSVCSGFTLHVLSAFLTAAHRAPGTHRHSAGESMVLTESLGPTAQVGGRAKVPLTDRTARPPPVSPSPSPRLVPGWRIHEGRALVDCGVPLARL